MSTPGELYVVCNLPGRGINLSRSIQTLLLALGEAWGECLRRKPLPSVYSGGIVYRPEPADSLAEEWCDPYTVRKRGYGDCDDLTIYRLAELYAAHGFADERSNLIAWPVVYWETGTGRYHVLVRHRDGSTEDPAQILLEKYG